MKKKAPERQFFIIEKIVKALDVQDALRRERVAKIIKVFPSPIEDYDNAIGFDTSPPPEEDDELPEEVRKQDARRTHRKKKKR